MASDIPANLPNEEPRASDPVDLRRLRDVTDGDAVFELELLTLFLGDCAKCMTRLTDGLVRQDMGQAEIEAHKLKGSSANIGAQRFNEIAGALETASKNEDASTAHEHNQELQDEFERVRLFLEAYLQD